MRLRKYHGLGNDFLVLVDPDGTEPVDADLARAVCDRHRGAGADGLIRVTGRGQAGHGGSPLTMELYNADGSTAETSGNGLRCLARAVVDAGLVDVGLVDGTQFTVATDAGPRRITVRHDGTISVEMGTARLAGRRVNLGNPHVVVEVSDLAKLDLAAQAAAFPAVNVEFVAPGPGTDELTMRVWERGVGETLSCGTGACAAAVVAHSRGMVGQRVTVHQPGGALVVDLGPPLTLSGPADFVCEVTFPWR